MKADLREATKMNEGYIIAGLLLLTAGMIDFYGPRYG